MNPYERTAAEMQRQSQGPKRFAQAAAGIGTAVAGASFAPMLARAAPLLSQYIPEGLAIKGLSKISPKFGKFIQEALNGGYDFQEIKDFIGNQINDSQGEQSSAPAKDNRNVIEQYSPELHNFMSQKVQGGEDPVRAAAMALFEKGSNFEPIIRKIEKEHKTNWSQLVQSIYGAGQGPAQAPPPGDSGIASIGKGMANGISDNFYQQSFDALKNGSTTMGGINDPFLQVAKQFFDKGQIQSPDDLKRLGQQYFSQKQQQGQQQQGQPQGGGQGNQALMAILQKINQRLGQ